MDTIEYATFRYDTVEVENGPNRNFPSRFLVGQWISNSQIYSRKEYYFMKTTEINLIGFYLQLLNLAWSHTEVHPWVPVHEVRYCDQSVTSRHSVHAESSSHVL